MNHQQQEILIQLGLRLQQARQQRGLTLEHIAAKTLISVRLLQAVEAAELAALPEPVYVQGFLKRYAEAMGFNGAAFAAEFPTYMQPKIYSNWSIPLLQGQLKPSHLYMAYFGLVAAAVSGLSVVMNRTQPATLVVPVQSAQPLPAKPAVPIPAVAQQPRSPGSANAAVSGVGAVAPVSGQSDVAIASASEDKLRLGLTVTDSSWVRVVADGNTAFEGELSQGTKKSWKASRQVTVTAGNAGGVLVSVNDGQAKPLGDPGDVKEVTFGSAAKEQAGVPGMAVSTTSTGSY